MLELTIDDELITTSGALSVFKAAVDELNRRYGVIDDDTQMNIDELLPPTGIFLVARSEGHLCGGVGLRRIVEPQQKLAEVKRLWVRPDLRRSGIAARLMDEIENRARAIGYARLYLETGPAQPEAIAFYPKHGWTRVEHFPAGAFTHESAYRFTKML
ncbi:MAG TPA: GNAT family N-acetyltransferase [Acidimicrobiales bacterium]